MCCRLSGESPFQGSSDTETFALVTAARYTFDEESFEDISDQAKDFISSLLKKDRRFGRLLSFFVPLVLNCNHRWRFKRCFVFQKTFLLAFAFSQVPAVVHGGPGPPLDGLVHPVDPQAHQVPQQGEDEAIPGQTQVEGLSPQ